MSISESFTGLFENITLSLSDVKLRINILSDSRWTGTVCVCVCVWIPSNPPVVHCVPWKWDIVTVFQISQKISLQGSENN